ncbi:MAG: hypothetical protein OXG49_03580 [Chloroflexi bacterium]|nr:hypothetical protein [Chloroflexota bacterium]
MAYPVVKPRFDRYNYPRFRNDRLMRMAMAYLNEGERRSLLDDLSGMRLWRAKFKLRLLDPKVRLLYLRNVQQSGQWHTKYVLESLGTEVTLVEVNHAANDQPSNKQHFEFVNVIVEPTADNRT